MKNLAYRPTLLRTEEKTRPYTTFIRGSVLPFLDPEPPRGMHDMLVLNHRPDLVEIDAPATAELEFFNVDFP